MKTYFKRLLAAFTVLCVAAVFTACVPKTPYDPNYVDYTNPFEAGVTVPYTGQEDEPSGGQLSNGEEYPPDGNGGDNYSPGDDGVNYYANNNGGGNNANNNGGAGNNTGSGGGGANSGGSATTKKNPGGTVTTTKKKTPVAVTNKPNTAGSAGSPFDSIFSLIGGGGGDQNLLDGYMKTITDMISSFQNGGLGGSGGGTTNPKDTAVEVKMTTAQARDIYNDALAKAYTSKPSMEKKSVSQLLKFDSDNPGWHIMGNVAATFINDTMKADAENNSFWPERGSVEESLFRIPLDTNNTRGMYSYPQQTGNVIFFDFGVTDPGVEFPINSENLTTSKIVDMVAKSMVGVSGREIDAKIEWGRVICAIDRSNGRFISLQHDFLLTVVISGSPEWPLPTTMQILMSQSYEKFRY